jgi:isopenicillin N synthase-like dioxygenase
MNTIPRLDLSSFVSGNTELKNEFVSQIGTAFEEFGFVCIKNIYIDKNDIDAYYKSIANFFALPIEAKQKYEIEGLAGQRGYTSFGKEHAKGSDAPDLKEFWQMGQTVLDLDDIKEEYPNNVMVSEISDFNDLGLKLYRGFEQTGSQILKAIALYLELEENYFDTHIHNGNSILRAIYYPPISQEPKNAIRAEAHEDINLITLLVGASAEGLQLLTKENEWIDINAPEDYFVINVGDMLQRLANNKLKSTTHRVVNPPIEKWATPRYSIPFFLHPRSEMDLTCLASCVENNELHYTPISAGAYLEERLIEIGLLKK